MSRYIKGNGSERISKDEAFKKAMQYVDLLVYYSGRKDDDGVSQQARWFVAAIKQQYPEIRDALDRSAFNPTAVLTEPVDATITSTVEEAARRLLIAVGISGIAPSIKPAYDALNRALAPRSDAQEGDNG